MSCVEELGNAVSPLPAPRGSGIVYVLEVAIARRAQQYFPRHVKESAFDLDRGLS